VLQYTESGREDFFADPMTQDAVVRNLEIVGEAAKRVSPSLQARAPAVPWREMAGMRDKLVHDYFVQEPAAAVEAPPLQATGEGSAPAAADAAPGACPPGAAPTAPAGAG
jgi:hypothetical protein